MDPPSSAIWMVILLSLLFIRQIFLTMIVSVLKYIWLESGGFSRLCLALYPRPRMHPGIHMFPQLVEIQSPPVYLSWMMVEKMQM